MTSFVPLFMPPLSGSAWCGKGGSWQNWSRGFPLTSPLRVMTVEEVGAAPHNALRSQQSITVTNIEKEEVEFFYAVNSWWGFADIFNLYR